MNGIIIVDKPEGFTSFDTVAVLRRICKEHKVGHTGTLDPMATGVLPVLLGCATKALNLLPESGKTYKTRFKLGIVTDTLDISGKILVQKPFAVTTYLMKETLNSFLGDIMQKPPIYSAKSKNGVRIYKLARQGIDVEREPCAVHISGLSLDCFDEKSGEGALTVSCSKGTYIRSLIDDIGSCLGCGAVMTALRRTEACGFGIDEALTPEKIQNLAESGRLHTCVRPIETVFSTYPQVKVTDKQTIRFKNGGELSLDRISAPSVCEDEDFCRVYSCQGEFLGLGEIKLADNIMAVKKLFVQNINDGKENR